MFQIIFISTSIYIFFECLAWPTYSHNHWLPQRFQINLSVVNVLIGLGSLQNAATIMAIIIMKIVTKHCIHSAYNAFRLH